MKNTKTWKRLTAGALALLVVAGTMPAGVNFGELIGGQSIVASADETLYSVPVNQSNDYGTLSASLSESSCYYVLTATPKSGYEFVKITAWNNDAGKLVECSNGAEFGDTEYEFELSDIKAYFRKTAVSISQEQFETINTSAGTSKTDETYNGTNCSVTGYYFVRPLDGNNGVCLGDYNSISRTITISASSGYKITKVEGTISWINEDLTIGDLQTTAGTLSSDNFKAGGTLTVDNIKGNVSEIVLSDNVYEGIMFDSFKVYYEEAAQETLPFAPIHSPDQVNFGESGGLSHEDAKKLIEEYRNKFDYVELQNVPDYAALVYNYDSATGKYTYIPFNRDDIGYFDQCTKDELDEFISEGFPVYCVGAEKQTGINFFEVTDSGYAETFGEGCSIVDAKKWIIDHSSEINFIDDTKGVLFVFDSGKLEGKQSYQCFEVSPSTISEPNMWGLWLADYDHFSLDSAKQETNCAAVYFFKADNAQTKTDISTATVTVDTESKSVSVKLDETDVPAEGYTLNFEGVTNNYSGTDFPTEAGTYKAKVTGTGDYEGEAESAEFTIVTYTKVESKDPTPTEEGNIEYYEGSDGNFYSLNNDGETYTKYENKNDVVLAKVTVTKVDKVDPTVNETGNIEYYEGSDGNFYSLNDDGETYTKYENKNDVVLAKIAVTKVDKVEPTVNDTGMEAHYEATIDNEKKCYTATLPENAISGEAHIATLREGDILAPGTRIFTADSGSYEVIFDGENAGEITYDNSFTTTTESYVEVDGLLLGLIYDTDPLIFKSTPTLKWAAPFISLKTYDLTYNEVDEQTLVIEKIKTTKVEAVDPTCTATGNIEYYTDPDDNIYVLKDGKYVESSLEEVTIAMLPYDHVKANEPTCDTDGNKEYWYDKFEDKYYLDEEGKEEVDADYVVIPATGHKYSATWKWAKDYSAATVTLNCVNDPDEEPIVLNAEITEERVESTCKTQGKITYFAKASYNNVDYTYPKTVKLPLGDHVYGEPEWQWIDKNNVKATFTCTECGETETVDATIRTETVAPTLTSAGKITYIASVTMQDKTYVDTRVQKLAKLPEAPTVTYTPGTGSVKLDWTAVDGAEKYAVCGEVDGKWQKLGSGTDTTFALYDLTSGKQYKVAVIAKVNGEWIEDYSKAIVVTPKAAANKYPKVTTIDYNDKYHQFRLNWDSVDGAQQYGVAVFLAGRWKIVTQDIPANTTNFTSPKLKAGQTYKMVVCAKIDGKWDTSNLTSRAFSVTVK